MKGEKCKKNVKTTTHKRKRKLSKANTMWRLFTDVRQLRLLELSLIKFN